MADADEPLAALEYEMMLLSRHSLMARQHRKGQVLERSAYVLLSRLELESPMSLKELAEALRLDISTVNRQVRSMITQDLVEGVIDPDGGAARKFVATAHGLKQLRVDRAMSTDGLGQVVEGWGPSDTETLIRLLRRFNRSVERLEDNEWPRPED
ncbi:MarR family winged helix-turn-helix transcriptional regulator [Rhodococcus sp. NPDC058521]|uniref:MarR family winged helix-turn-helix transcriptional regulator n=1 Tax=Rhodococcus sp. NPDC058521 TaxID=3346536 RepID=UPI00364B719D